MPKYLVTLTYGQVVEGANELAAEMIARSALWDEPMNFGITCDVDVELLTATPDVEVEAIDNAGN